MNKTILILGASSDVGLELISNTHKDFDAIVAHYNSNARQLDSLKETIGEKLHSIQADFSSIESTKNFIGQVEDNYGCPTHIVHFPATKVRNINFYKSNWEHVESDLNISLRSIYMITQHFVRHMSKAKCGKIVFMLTSNVAVTPKYMLDYTTVKYALLGFMKSLATEYADKSIIVNAVSPSMIETKFLSNVPDMIIQQSAQNNPLKRNALVDDVVPAIRFLLSDEANYITGQNLIISGGSVIG